MKIIKFKNLHLQGIKSKIKVKLNVQLIQEKSNDLANSCWLDFFFFQQRCKKKKLLTTIFFIPPLSKRKPEGSLKLVLSIGMIYYSDEIGTFRLDVVLVLLFTFCTLPYEKLNPITYKPTAIPSSYT